MMQTESSRKQRGPQGQLLHLFWGELTANGFVKSHGKFRGVLDRYPGLRPKVVRFNIGTGHHGAMKYTAFDLFGHAAETYIILDNAEAKQKFVKTLSAKFLKQNPAPSDGLRRAFTRLIHSFGFHWSGCSHMHIPDDIRAYVNN